MSSLVKRHHISEGRFGVWNWFKTQFMTQSTLLKHSTAWVSLFYRWSPARAARGSSVVLRAAWRTTSAPGRRTALWTEWTGTDASSVDYRNAWPSECLAMVSRLIKFLLAQSHTLDRQVHLSSADYKTHYRWAECDKGNGSWRELN